ncbi:hypothetical protein SAMD00020551_4831 [Mesobacillus selenatarsenatis SF-1]|uniref:Uncharacterized protein n=1 Tax=Mesobacillus selenatarsenatis (strain DSM 18680 / JCM 14380 / FERM P-15431 / SF-1) TaxID=1321606 RepID=A0A0A8XC49_MESS1|nr:hypothetical protein SAMD00020551_4831 [Mesobacillus selenatarsenatis SF-1]
MAADIAIIVYIHFILSICYCSKNLANTAVAIMFFTFATHNKFISF